MPAWSAVSAGNMERALVLPSTIRKVIIAADRDTAGQRAASAAWRRWRAEGRDVLIATPNVDGEDFNDIAREGRT
jgi:hypothetical protein